ncbi:hypothetical protein F5I97DRAFT_1937005 [Phlebopus sp. FC_14]|nr:hypothetical protein F5I97DRAFT_1937005 [Phlebopus sp. FC_14]
MVGPKPNPAASQPLIPEHFIDVPSQRLYYLSFGFLLQAVKVLDVIQSLFASDAPRYYGRKWFCVDLAYVVILSKLRIPRLRYSNAVVLLQIISLWFLDGILFGGISLNIGRDASLSGYPGLQHRPELSSTTVNFRLADFLTPSGFLSFFSDSTREDKHLLGQHTVRMSPISTAHLNPDGNTFCLSPPAYAVLIPIVVNNTTPANVRYLFTPLPYLEGQSGTGRVDHVELSARDLKAIEQARLEGLQAVRSSTLSRDSQDFDEYDDDNDDGPSADSRLQKTQSLAHIRVTKPGSIRLDRVLDGSNVAVRLGHPTEVTVVPCPTAHFTDESLPQAKNAVRCAGDNSNLDLTIDIRGVPPLSLRWAKVVNEKREDYLVEGIEDNSATHRSLGDPPGALLPTSKTPQKLKVPLSLPADSLGQVTFILDSVIDGMGNVISLDQGVSSEALRRHGIAPDSKTSRSLKVLQRPSVSFRNCGPGNPMPLLIGSEASLPMYVINGDPLDAPWDVNIKFEPSEDEKGAVKSKPWKKTLQTQNDKRDLAFRASAPGEFIITSLKGKWCDGDVLSPDTCKVVEKPMPTAEIEWKRIHECSGDTGVSASLILHGTPPFQVYYRTQRDNENPRDVIKTFGSSRGELTLQPEHSGHYYYTFLQLSDANYKQVPLNGPSIDQVVHPPAAADFVSGNASGRSKRALSSCSGSFVDVAVELRGTPPWNLQLQIVGPNSAHALEVRDIKSSPARIEVPIPSVIDKEGGTFEVDLVSVEDTYGCKRPISVPGVSVNVRRVQPTAKFYSKNGLRQVTILEDEETDLPLRLTGDGPWEVKYRRIDDRGSAQRAYLQSPNDHIHVSRRGVYELLEVSDSQCPGTIILHESQYNVYWVPRPSARLDPLLPSVFESYNRSYILPPTCQGRDDHVDLELTGRPPFQIMYNIAKKDESGGGTTVLDQPTFSSIQSRMRFQLHTLTPGRKYYEVKQIGDAAYPLHKYKNVVIPRSERLVFEQEVLPKPSAKFKTDSRLSFCLNDVLVPRDRLSSDGTIVLEGTPPFEVQLSIKNLAASKVRKETVQIVDKTWRLELPSYYFTSIGPYQVSIDSVQDSSRCEQAELDPLRRSIWIDVAETAAIIPLEKGRDYCVGDVTQFQLEGTPPWTIGYRINGKSYTQEARVSPFSIVQQQAGDFTIASIAHQQQMCKAAITNVRLAIHPLPSAQVGHGKRIYQDIHEGDQAEIVFTLIGEPPFTFTYQRSEPTHKRVGKPGKVLETHTISGVTTHEYSVFSALEGTWTVTSISDRYCRYPTLQDGLEKRL